MATRRVCLALAVVVLAASVHQVRSVTTIAADYGSRFEKSMVLSPPELDDVRLYWTVNQRLQDIHLALVTRSTGWVGLGLSDKGTMRGADIAILQQDTTSGEFQVGDYYSKDFVTPLRDPEHLQNFFLLDVQRNATHTAFHIKRKILTCDDNDVAISTAPMFVMYALGHDGAPQQLQYHRSRGSSRVSFFIKELLKEEPTVAADHVFTSATFNSSNLPLNADTFALDLTVDQVADYKLPSHTSTTYACFQFDLSQQLGTTPVYMTGFAGLHEHDPYIHHATFLACSAAGFASVGNAVDECFIMPDECVYAGAWALGVEYQALPDGVASQLGGAACADPSASADECKNKFIMQLHYENPARVDGGRARFGLRFFLRSQPLHHDFGLYRLSATHAAITVPPGATSSVAMECPGECTSQLPPGGINVFVTFLHAHKTGQSVRLRHVRDGVELEALGSVDVFDFNKQVAMPTNRVLLPGDRLLLECDYNASAKAVETVGGFGSEDEMCLAVLAYYPRFFGPNICAAGVKTPGAVYCGRDGNTGYLEDVWPAEHTLHVPMPRPSFQPLDVADETCYRLAYGIGEVQPVALLTMPVPLTAMLVALIMLQHVAGAVLTRVSPKYRTMTAVHQQNVKVYVINLVGLSVVLVVSLATAGMLSFGDLDMVEATASGMKVRQGLQGFTASMMLLGGVMIIDMATRLRSSVLLELHHIITLALTAVLAWAAYVTVDAAYMSVGFLLSLSATTEQPVFIALLLRRFAATQRAQRRAFWFAAVYTLVVKTLLFVATMIVYFGPLRSRIATLRFSWLAGAEEWNEAMLVVVPVLVVALYLVQVNLVRVLVLLARRHGQGKTQPTAIEQSATP